MFGVLLMLAVLIMIALKLWPQQVIDFGLNIYTGFFEGNRREYRPENMKKDPCSILNGKNVIFLGSSVTYGTGSKKNAMAEYLAARDDITYIKNAVGGSTLVTQGGESYISRMLTIDKTLHADAFVCQLSTNDASQSLSLGKMTEGKSRESFDQNTVAGAIEYIISYVQETWGCPVFFYTNPQFENEQYGEMVKLLKEIAEKWDIKIIDLWNDKKFNQITDEQRKLYMVDNIHPTMAGYRDWWLPVFERELSAWIR